MTEDPVALIAYQDFENLGIGYLASMLESNGIEVVTIDIRDPHYLILKEIQEISPTLIGFSLIFQYHTENFKNLAAYLRRYGIDCHFTMGGHYPSLRPGEVLKEIPQIDSVVRFEGESTLLELVDNLQKQSDWKKIRGIAYRDREKTILNNPRPLIENLDEIPFPRRDRKFSLHCQGVVCTFLLASRGCVHDCIFCSIRKFYGIPPGRIRRNRSPENLIREIKELSNEMNARIFLFQDDDFIPPGRMGRQWVMEFIEHLHEEGLSQKIIWKISCRADEVDRAFFRKMRGSGLRIVYLGIETGTQRGLEFMNKGCTITDNYNAMHIVKELKMLSAYGFMLFDPSTTFESLRMNLDFLQKICDDSGNPVVFCKMIPYAETEIERRLLIEGRLRGSRSNPDYSFLDQRIDELFSFVNPLISDWMHTGTGIKSKLSLMQFQILTMKEFNIEQNELPEYREELNKNILMSNQLMLSMLNETVDLFDHTRRPSKKALEGVSNKFIVESKKVQNRIQNLSEQIISLRVNNQDFNAK